MLEGENKVQAYYKALTPDMKGFYDNSTMKWKRGKRMPVKVGLHYCLSKSVGDAITSIKFPFRVFVAQPCGKMMHEDHHRAWFTSAKVIREVRKPFIAWRGPAEKFLKLVKSMNWMDNHAKPRDSWKLYDTRKDVERVIRGMGPVWPQSAAYGRARDDAGGWARAVAGFVAMSLASTAAKNAIPYGTEDARYDAMRDVEMMSNLAVAHGHRIPRASRKYIMDRWEVWARGYGLRCEVNGVLYCYRREKL